MKIVLEIVNSNRMARPVDVELIEIICKYELKIYYFKKPYKFVY